MLVAERSRIRPGSFSTEGHDLGYVGSIPTSAKKGYLKMLRVLDLSKAEKHFHPDVDLNKKYLVKIAGEWYFGGFKKVWFGLNFSPWKNGMVGIQFDAPGFNSSGWERIIEIDLEELDRLPLVTPL